MKVVFCFVRSVGLVASVLFEVLGDLKESSDVLHTRPWKSADTTYIYTHLRVIVSDHSGSNSSRRSVRHGGSGARRGMFT